MRSLLSHNTAVIKRKKASILGVDSISLSKGNVCQTILQIVIDPTHNIRKMKMVKDGTTSENIVKSSV